MKIYMVCNGKKSELHTNKPLKVKFGPSHDQSCYEQLTPDNEALMN